MTSNVVANKSVVFRRNPHDLYHYADPENRVIAGRVEPPRRQMRNDKIILRHMVAASAPGYPADRWALVGVKKLLGFTSLTAMSMIVPMADCAGRAFAGLLAPCTHGPCAHVLPQP